MSLKDYKIHLSMHCTAVYNFPFSNICTFWNIVNLMIPNRVGIGHPFNHPEFRGSSTRRFDEILSCCCCSSQRRIFGILGICSPHSKREFFFLSNHNTHFTVSINLTRKKSSKLFVKFLLGLEPSILNENTFNFGNLIATF